MAVHQCPHCPLRFSFRTELEFHLREDHERGRRTEDAEHAGEPGAHQHRTDQKGSRPVELGAASVTALIASPRSGVLPVEKDRSPSSWPDIESTSGTLEGESSVGVRRIDRPSRPIPMMPRWVVVTVIAMIIIALGLVLLFA